MTEFVSSKSECPSCGSASVSYRDEVEHIPYGNGSDQVLVPAKIPFGSCEACGFVFTDARAEILRHEAVCRHLGVQTPAEVAELRKKYSLTRAQLAEVTGIGEASIARWERGSLIQNLALDQLLYLLSFRENFVKLRSRSARNNAALASSPEASGAMLINFPNLKNVEKAQVAASAFRLRRTGI